MITIILSGLHILFKVIGCMDAAEALIDRINARKKAQEIANIPTTKKEISDAADKGQL